MIKKAALVTTTVVCTLLLISLADHMFGDPHGLVLPRRSHFRYETTEFVFDVDTNALGFRDREVSPKREFRAIAIGDSFTYGWGVQLDQSWPKLLEKNLGIEVLNLGHPGASPIDYARTSEAAIPLLKPDLVIVAVLQGEDLSQIAFPPVPKRSISYLLTRIMDRAYPNTLDYLRRNARNHVTLKQEWQTLSIELFNDLSKTERDRFDRLDGRIRGKFFAGDLNPTLVQGGVVWPDYFYLGLDAHRPEIGKMAAYLARIKAAADRAGAKVVVISVPYAAYQDAHDIDNLRLLGFHVTDEMASSTAPDEATKTACQLAGVEFETVTGSFRTWADQGRLFFEYDSHFNADGHRKFAELLTPEINRIIKGERTP